MCVFAISCLVPFLFVGLIACTDDSGHARASGRETSAERGCADLGGANQRKNNLPQTSPSVHSILRKSLPFFPELVRSADFPVADRRDHQRWADGGLAYLWDRLIFR